jgi:hypothetical protein
VSRPIKPKPGDILSFEVLDCPPKKGELCECGGIVLRASQDHRPSSSARVLRETKHIDDVTDITSLLDEIREALTSLKNAALTQRHARKVLEDLWKARTETAVNALAALKKLEAVFSPETPAPVTDAEVLASLARIVRGLLDRTPVGIASADIENVNAAAARS